MAFDCFLLIDGEFAPRGKLKPGEKYGVAPDGWFAFEPDGDPFNATPLDLRWLNERTAGDGGYIRAKGDAFVHEKTGQPVRFWGVNVEPELLSEDGRALDRMARRLAKLGVNIVQGPWPPLAQGRSETNRRHEAEKASSVRRRAQTKRDLSRLSPPISRSGWDRTTSRGSRGTRAISIRSGSRSSIGRCSRPRRIGGGRY